jgi:dual specificity phosphatase 12
MSEILPRLLLGGADLLYDLEFLHEYKITHVLTIMDEDICTPAMIAARVTHMTVRLDDVETAPIGDYFAGCISFIRDALGGGGAVFVHCLMGISRSPTMVAAFLMKTQGLNAEKALEFIRARRPIIDPNQGFRKALQNLFSELENGRRGGGGQGDISHLL